MKIRFGCYDLCCDEQDAYPIDSMASSLPAEPQHYAMVLDQCRPPSRLHQPPLESAVQLLLYCISHMPPSVSHITHSRVRARISNDEFLIPAHFLTTVSSESLSRFPPLRAIVPTRVAIQFLETATWKVPKTRWACTNTERPPTSHPSLSLVNRFLP